MRKKNIILEWDDEIAQDSVVWGIVSSAGYLKLVHFINKTGFFDFTRKDNIEYSVGETKSSFICYSYNDNETETYYKLVVNRGDNGIIDKKLKNIDMILSINSESNETIEAAYAILNNNNMIETVFEIDLTKQSHKAIDIII